MFKKSKFEQLRAISDETCVSIYIPTEITGDYEKNRIRWKNACQDAIRQLEEKGVDNISFMKPALDLIDNSDFWAHQSAALVGFYSEHEQGHYHLLSPNKALVVVHQKFYLSPILKEIVNSDRLFVLALSQGDVKFYEAVRSGIYPVNIKDVVPTNMEAALNLDITKNSIQSHSAGGNAIFHGNDSGDDKQNIRIRQYFRKVDEGLLNFIHDEKVPLVLAAVESYYSIYRDVTDYKYFSQHMITGNPEDLSPGQIREQLEPVFKDLQKKRLESFVQSYNQRVDEALTIDGLEELSESAKLKNIAKLLVCQTYWDILDKDQKIKLDETMLMIYDQGGDIVITDPSDHECETLHAVQRFQMA